MIIKTVVKKFLIFIIKDFNYLLNQYLKLNPNSYFIQIGANDGIDDLHKFILKYKNISGILFEPQKNEYKKLCNLHKNNPHIQIENIGISEKEETKPFYKLSFSNSRWATGLSSFKPSSIEKNIKSGYIKNLALKDKIDLPPLSKWIETIPIKTKTLSSIFEKYNITQLDLLYIDTEGLDGKIILSIPFDKIYPKIIYFEHVHLSAKEKIPLFNYLKNNNYTLIADKINSINTIAIHHSILKFKFVRKMIFRNKIVQFFNNAWSH